LPNTLGSDFYKPFLKASQINKINKIIHINSCVGSPGAIYFSTYMIWSGDI